MTPQSRARRWAALAAEVCGSLLLVLAVFWLFMLFLYALFPSGTPLKELIESRLEALPARHPAERQAEATLASLQHDVRFRSGNSLVWSGAREGMPLYSNDAVQTFDRSGASISFGAGDQLAVGSNSLVRVTRLDAGDEAGPRTYRVQVDGELRGSLSDARKLRFELATAGHLARISPGAARFRIARNGADCSSLAVYAGEAEVQGAGGIVRVPANFGVTLRRGVAVGAVLPLPWPPMLGKEQAVYRYRLLPPRIRFSWSGAPGDYQFQLSTDPRFTSRLIDERVGGPEFVAGKLAEGKFFWRVRRVEEGRAGPYSRVGSCELVQVLAAPKLQVRFPEEGARAGRYTLSGSSEPGTRVFVDGGEVALESTGKFTREVELKPGVNLIRVEALDATGNASYASRIVYGRPDGQGAGAPAR